ncbi:Cell wall-associated hydrolase, NlpC family [Streptosporangium canum]|uniref:Cell wall-associated hydrolase, NlpC family n=1 Tax=Streptosporangium canum TaxID=324952 RepID=A0A1I4E0D3_9ACTN|nr:C40 family peptidase [Streptosporangium canum]SFK97581.1 Cell wall-associated hydrolase, NlpC family [Streptosporangium canum]
MQSVERCCRAGVMVAGLTCCLITCAAVPAVAVRDRVGPSAEEVARARSKAGERSKQLGETTALLAKAQAELGELSGRARKLIEIYEGERASAARAEELLRQARERAEAGRPEKVREAAVTPVRGDGGTLWNPAQEGGAAVAHVQGAAVPAQGGGAAVVPAQRGGAAVVGAQGGGAVMIPRQGDGGTVAIPAREAVTALKTRTGTAETEAGQPGTAEAEAVRTGTVEPEDGRVEVVAAEAAWYERRKAAERAAAARKAAEEAVAGQAAETRRIEADRARLDRQAKAETIVAERLAGKRVAVLKWTRVAKQRARQGKRRSAAVARKRARFVAARGTVPTWPLNTTWQAARGDIAADWALTQLDKPYLWAATGPGGYDCSGLTMQAWARAGVRLDHWTGTQWTSGRHVQLSQVRRGDLLFFGRITRNPGDISHVGIYIGRGLMVHAPQTGDVVRVAPIWRRDLIGATRPD